MGEFLISLISFFVLISVALILCNFGVAAISGLSFNPQYFFNHQTIEFSEWNPSSEKHLDLQNSLQIKNRKKSLGIDAIVPIAESKWLEDVKVEQGEMKFYLDIPDELPMHLTEADIDKWVLWVNVTGGYTPFYGDDWSNTIKVYQKDREGKSVELVGKIKIDWEQGPYFPSNTYLWFGNLDIVWSKSDPNAEYLSLDSSYYPIVYSDPNSPDDDWFLEDYNLPDYIPRKSVDFKFKTHWSGCEQDDQSFLIISVLKIHQFPL